jgi:hypothetical protein
MDQLDPLINALRQFNSSAMEAVGLSGFLLVMLVSLACGVFIAKLYTHFYSGRATGSQIQRAFPLLSIAITAIFVTIQFSLPLSLGLLGALSIVRFRTPVKEPEEIGFVMLVIAAAISCASMNFIFLCIVLMTAFSGLLMLRSGWLRSANDECLLVVTMPASEFRQKADELIRFLRANTRGGQIDSITSTGGAAVITYSFRDFGPGSMQDLQGGLQALVGESYDFFFNQLRVA